MIQIKADKDEENGVLSIVYNSSFKAYRVPRINATSVITSTKSAYRDVFSGYGVYILIEDDTTLCHLGTDSETYAKPIKFYVGKAGDITKRFVSHCSPKSVDKLHLEWTDAIIFIGTDKMFPWGEDEIQWFEHRLLKGIMDAERYQYTNVPGQTKPGKVDEYRCENQLSDMMFLISLLGYPKLFSPLKRNVPVVKSNAIQVSHSKGVPGQRKRPSVKDSINAYKKFPYTGAGVLSSVLQELSATNGLESNEVDYLLSLQAEKDFVLKRSSVRVLKESDGTVDEHLGPDGRSRYTCNLTVEFFGKKYLVTRELWGDGFLFLMGWAKEHGFNEQDVLTLCEKYGVKKKKRILRSLYDRRNR